jgi:hypothetical protein
MESLVTLELMDFTNLDQRERREHLPVMVLVLKAHR